MDLEIELANELPPVILNAAKPWRDHPLYPEQVQLEVGMMQEGADAFQALAVKATREREAVKLRPVRQLVTDFLPSVASALQTWCRASQAATGPKPTALPYVLQADRWTASLVALKAVLNGITARKTFLTALAIQIGQDLEHELQCRAWEKKDRKLFNAVQAQQERQGATDKHRRRVNINRFNHLIDTQQLDFEWIKWSKEVHFRVGIALIEAVIMGTGWFQIGGDPEHEHRTGVMNSPKLIIQPLPGITEWLAKAFDHFELHQPVFKPTIIPPKPWTCTTDGGYFTPYVRTPRMIRFKASMESQKDRAADEYDALEMANVYKTTNWLQSRPWRVNKRVLNVASRVWTLDSGIANIPQNRELDLPPKPHDIDTNAEAKRDWKRQASSILRRNATLASKIRGTKRTIETAQQYERYEELYFPHVLDFRGRMYPVPVGLQPQGNDLARGLLEFREGKACTEENEGGDWLAVQLANSWGIDKVDFAERIDWVHDREELWRNIDLDPFTTLDWAACDKPWQALAAIFDWVAFLDAGFGYISHANISVDGTCNGIQHLAALTRDPIAGRLVNLTNSERPQDIYRYVAEEEVQPELERLRRNGGERGEYADWWLANATLGTTGNIPRSLTKRPVMVMPYGGTKEAYFKYIREWLNENGHQLPYDATKEEWSLQGKRVAFLVQVMWQAVARTAKGAVEVMDWIMKCAKATCKGNQPIFWTTPTGLTVRHFYGTAKSRELVTKLDGQRYKLRMLEYSANLDPKAQLQGISPNFIHSLDADSLRKTILLAIEAGRITAMSAVHDAYGTHAADMHHLSELLRQAFIDTHKSNPLDTFRAACCAVLVDYYVSSGKDVLEASEIADGELPRPLELGTLDIEEVMGSTYFFA